MSDFGRIGDALAAGQRAEAKINIGPIVTAGAEFASVSFTPADFMSSSYFDAINRENEFMWGLDKWGDKTYKVGA